MGSVICTSRNGHRGAALRGRVLSLCAGVGLKKWKKKTYGHSDPSVSSLHQPEKKRTERWKCRKGGNNQQEQLKQLKKKMEMMEMTEKLSACEWGATFLPFVGRTQNKNKNTETSVRKIRKLTQVWFELNLEWIELSWVELNFELVGVKIEFFWIELWTELNFERCPT